MSARINTVGTRTTRMITRFLGTPRGYMSLGRDEGEDVGLVERLATRIDWVEWGAVHDILDS